MLGIQCKDVDFDVQINGITDKPENVTRGSAFVCIEGKKFDGHNSVPLAFSKGCAAVICSRDVGSDRQIIVEDTRLVYSRMLANFYADSLKKIKIIGITGTNGKTSTSFFLRHILESAGKKTGIIGTLGALYGEGVQKTDMTTPEPDKLYKILADMAEYGCEYCVAEVSSQALAQNRCAALVFETGVFTNLGRDHLDYHSDAECYAQAKARLFSQCKRAVFNADDKAAELMARKCRGEKIYFSANGKEAELMADNIQSDSQKTIYTLIYQGNKYTVTVPAVGIFSVYNTLAAIGAALLNGIPVSEAAAYRAGAVCAPGRAERLQLDKPYSVYIDYAHTPDALGQMLKSLRSITKGRLVTVFGCGGDRDKEKRPLMGEAASSLADVLILTDDNPRTESPEKILADIMRGINGAKPIVKRDRREAIKYALNIAETGDTILIAGKGHEEYQIIGTKKIPFSDRNTVFALIE